MNKKSLAIIPARSGSKRIPFKNIKIFTDKPIIYYPIKAAIEANCFDEVMVSTDDQKIARIAEKFGAKIPFLRTLENSSDSATTAEVILEVVNNYRKLGTNFDYICCLYPTSVFATSELINKGLSILTKFEATNSVITVQQYSHPPQRSFKISGSYINPTNPSNLNARTQDLVPLYHDAGQLYWLKSTQFIKNSQIITKKTQAMILNKLEACDIDDQEDWELAELIFNKHK